MGGVAQPVDLDAALPLDVALDHGDHDDAGDDHGRAALQASAEHLVQEEDDEEALISPPRRRT